MPAHYYSPGGLSADTMALLAARPPGFAVLGGDDVLISPLLALGADGGILASAHLATAAFARLVRLWRAGDAVAARVLGSRLSALSAALAAALSAEPNPVVIKAVLHEQGRIPDPGVRLPLLAAGPGTITAACRLADELASEPAAAAG